MKKRIAKKIFSHYLNYTLEQRNIAVLKIMRARIKDRYKELPKFIDLKEPISKLDASYYTRPINWLQVGTPLEDINNALKIIKIEC